jgi:hypothetical protein
MMMIVFWDVAPCSLVEFYQGFRGACCLHHQGYEYASETLINFYQTNNNYKNRPLLHTVLGIYLPHQMRFSPSGPSSMVIFTMFGSDIQRCIIKIFNLKSLMMQTE